MILRPPFPSVALLALAVGLSAGSVSAQISSTGAVLGENDLIAPVWNAGIGLRVGYESEGSLTINGGGYVVASNFVFVGPNLQANAGVTGYLDVAGGLLSYGKVMTIGTYGNGRLIVRNGGNVAPATLDPDDNIAGIYAVAERDYESLIQISGGVLNTGNYFGLGVFQGASLLNRGDTRMEISGSGAVVSRNADLVWRAVADVSGGNWVVSDTLTVFNAKLEVRGTGTVTAATLDLAGEGYIRDSGELSVGTATFLGLTEIHGGNLSASASLSVNRTSATLSVMRIHGGEVTAPVVVVNGTLEVEGGLLDVSDSLTLGANDDALGIMTINGGQVRAPRVMMATDENLRQATLNLNGGVLTTAGLVGGANNAPIVRFDGGTLQLTEDSSDIFATFLPGAVTLRAGGGTLDTQEFDRATAYGLSGAGKLTKRGSGKLTLSGTNTYAGGTTVGGGTLSITGSVHHPDASVLVSGPGNSSLLTLGGSASLTSASTMIAGGEARVSGGSWTNAGSLVLGVLGNGRLTISGGSVTTGDVTVGATSPGSGAITLSGGVLNTGQVSKGLATTATFTFDGGELRLTGDQNDLFNGFSSGAVTLGPDGGVIDTQDFSVASAANLGGAGTLTKQGTGTLTLSGDNTYTGATLVNSGRLVINGSLASTSVTLASGASLGGAGSFAGLVTFGDGATLAPGNSPDTLTFTNGLALEHGAILDFELGTVSDLIVVSGGTLTGPAGLGGLTLNLADAGGFAPGNYTLIDYTSATLSDFDVADFVFGTTIAGYIYSLEFTGTTLALGVAAIPEPSTYAALAGLLALALARCRRRKM